MSSHAIVLAKFANASKFITTHMDVERDTGSGFTDAELDALAAAAANSTRVDAIMANYSSDMEFRAGVAYGVELETISPTPPEPPFYRKKKVTLDHTTLYTKAGGVLTSTSGAPTLALALSLYSTFPGPQGRGRMFWPQPSEGDIDATGSVSSAFATALKSDLNDWRAGVEGAIAGAVHVIWSMVTGDWHDVATTKMGLRLDSQRRRRQKETSYV